MVLAGGIENEWRAGSCPRDESRDLLSEFL